LPYKLNAKPIPVPWYGLGQASRRCNPFELNFDGNIGTHRDGLNPVSLQIFRSDSFSVGHSMIS
jgi:hypothetical protein